jgi:uncharacterized membrane protein YphA (DoxX/SURF4 family)
MAGVGTVRGTVVGIVCGTVTRQRRRRVGLALVPLRAFLGFTFCLAGLQKLANPGFFDASNPASIQAQLAGAEGSADPGPS